MSEYDDIIGHQEMVFDRTRNLAYEKAIIDLVTPDSVVLDLGAGLGIHGLMAAKAGAKKVYMVDPSPAVLVAGEIASSNGFHNVEAINSSIEKIDLPEKVDLIISVFTGNFLLTEDLLPSLFHARDKYLREGGQMIPDKAIMKLQPVCAESFYESEVDCWGKKGDVYQQFGIEQEVVRKYAVNHLYYRDFQKIDVTALAHAIDLLELDFTIASRAECFGKWDVDIQKSDRCHGYLGWFDMHLGDQWLSTAPQSEHTHWSQVFIPLESPIDLSKGKTLNLEFKRPEFGDWSWSTSYKPGDISYKQSSFLSLRLDLKGIQRQRPDYRPRLSDEGQAMQQALNLMDGQHRLDKIAQNLTKDFPNLFKSEDLALNYLKNLAKKIT